jgi:hypothetical protein
MSVNLLKGTITYASPPAVLPPLPKARPAGGKMFQVKVPDPAVPDSEIVFRTAGITSCTPVLLLEDGKPLPIPGVPVTEVKEKGEGRYVHKMFGIGFSTVDGTSPLENGRVYTAVLDPTRQCRAGRWLYPGDVATFALGGKPLRALTKAASRLDLALTAFGDSPGPLTVRIRAGDTVVLDTTVPLVDLQAHPPRIDLPIPLPRDTADLQVELSTPVGAPYVIVSGATLVEPVPKVADASP